MIRLATRVAGLMLSCPCTRPTDARALEVFACEPEWAALATELGATVSVFTATTAHQDPPDPGAAGVDRAAALR